MMDVTGIVDRETYELIFDGNSLAPTTVTTGLPTRPTETSASETQTASSEEETGTSPASAEETKPTSATPSQEEPSSAETTQMTEEKPADTSEDVIPEESEIPFTETTQSENSSMESADSEIVAVG